MSKRESRHLPPPMLVLLEAASVPDLHGARVMVGDELVGWRSGRAAGDPTIRYGTVRVPVLAESEFWRARLDPQLRVRTHLEPIDRVWVEQFLPRLGGDKWVLAPRSTADADGADVVRSLVPPARAARPVEEAGSAMGRRLVRLTADGRWSPCMATSEVFRGDGGLLRVLVAEQEAWWRWSLWGQDPAVEAVPVTDLWVY